MASWKNLSKIGYKIGNEGIGKFNIIL